MRTCFLFLWAGLFMSTPATADEPIKATVGEHGVVFPAAHHGLNYFPDEPISLLSKSPFRFLMVAGNSTRLMQGQTPESAVPVRMVLAPGPKTLFDNGYAGITSTYYDKKAKRLLAFYHAEDHMGMPMVRDNPDVHGAYWSVGLATSKDNGNTFKKDGQILRCSISKKKVTKEHQGIGDVHVLPDATNTYLYAYYTDLTRRQGNDRATIALARCLIADGGKPDKWFKHRDGEFKEKGLGGEESAVVTAPTDFPSEVIQPHVTYLPDWNKYIMVCCVLSFADYERKRGEEGGIFFCSSDDGIKWSKLKRLVVGLPNPLKDHEYIAHPTLYLDKVMAKKAEGWLLYCYTLRWGTQAPRMPHHLARRSITMTLGE